MIDQDRIRKAVIYLRIVFWGWVLHVAISTVACFLPPFFSLHKSVFVYGSGLQTYATTLVLYGPGYFITLVGICALSTVRVNWRYTLVMLIATIMYILRVLPLFLVDPPSHRLVMLSVYQWQFHDRLPGLLILLALPVMVLICVAMKAFCARASLFDSACRWRKTWKLFLVMGLIPGTLCTSGLVIVATVRESSLHRFPQYWLFIILKLLAYSPLIYFYITTSHMLREAKAVIFSSSEPHVGEPPSASIIED